MINVLYKFAYSKLKNKIVHIREIENNMNGLKCECVCVNCGKTMMAKIGKVRQIHFSHIEKCEKCNPDHANETALHKLAKRVFETHSSVILPSLIIKGDLDENCNKNDKRQLEMFKCFDNYFFNYKEVVVEKNEGDIRPDIVLKGEKESLLVEIAVTHKIDNIKKEKIRRRGLSCVEIDVKCFYELSDDFTLEKFKNVLIYEVGLKKWVYNRNEKMYLYDLKNRNKQLQKDYLVKEKQKNLEKGSCIQNNFLDEEQKIDNEKIKKMGWGQVNIVIVEDQNIDELIEGASQVKNKAGVRLIKCVKCGIIDVTGKFQRYGQDHINKGVCDVCAIKEREVNKQ